jgi:murein DD-endopeptidase MepM/ murein hydrolase activator NlpD
MEEQLENSRDLSVTLKKEIELLSKQKNKTDNIKIQESETNQLDSMIIDLTQQAWKKKLSEPNNDRNNAVRKSYISQLIKYRATLQNQVILSPTDSLLLSKNHSLTLEEIRVDSLTSELLKLKEKLKNQIVSTQKTEAVLNQKTSLRESLNEKIAQLMVGQPQVYTSNYNSNYRSLEDEKGFIPWPLTDAKMKLRYGEQKHPEDNKVTFVNSGIDMSSNSSEVKSVHNGTVITVTNISPTNTAVIIQHDNDYYSVYSNLLSANKRKGDVVGVNENIGVCNSINGEYVLHFELWQGKSNLNPYQWLKNN